MSETARCRPRLMKYCVGNGVDLGFGGEAITPSAVTVDLPQPYCKVGSWPQHLRGDATKLEWFTDASLDFVYSSHLLEDFPPERTVDILREWLRVIKTGGHLIIFCPDEVKFKAHCKATGQGYNNSHSVPDFSLEYLKGKLGQTGVAVKVVHEIPLIDDYSFDLVVEKL